MANKSKSKKNMKTRKKTIKKNIKKTVNKKSRKIKSNIKIKLKKKIVEKRAKTKKKNIEIKKKTKRVYKPLKNKMNKLWCDRLLKDAQIRQWLIHAIGEHAIHVIREFSKEMSDEDIAKKSNIRPSDVRVVLNKMHAYGLATYYRDKDKKSGWYSYIWKLHEDRAFQLEQLIKEKLSKKEDDNLKEGCEYYYCPEEREQIKISFEVAAENKFRCQNCGGSLKFFERRKIRQ